MYHCGAVRTATVITYTTLTYSIRSTLQDTRCPNIATDSTIYMTHIMYILFTLRFSKYYDPSLEQFLDIAKRFPNTLETVL